MEVSEYKHTLVLNKNAWFLKFYCWMWDASPSEVNFCKLFWGYIFAPFNLLVRFFWMLLWPFRKIVSAIEKRRFNKRVKYASNVPPPPKPREDVPSKASEFFARPMVRRIAKAIGLFGLLVGALITFFWLVVLAKLIIPLIPGTPWVLGICAEFIGQNIGIILLILLFMAFWSVVIWLFIEQGVPHLERRAIEYDKNAQLRKLRRQEAGKLTFRQTMKLGAKAVKSNTCPRIEIKE